MISPGLLFFFAATNILGMENIIYYVWKNRLFPYTGLHTTSGENLRVIDSGSANSKGNIFNNAKIKIGENLWVGNVVLHSKSSDW